jgi:hypothetical protein
MQVSWYPVRQEYYRAKSFIQWLLAISIGGLSLTWYIHTSEQHHHDVAHGITRKIFGPTTVDFSTSDLDFVEELIYQLTTASTLQQYEAASIALMILEKQHKKLDQKITRLQKEQQFVSLTQWHEHFAQQVQRNHLQTTIKKLEHLLSWKEKARALYDKLTYKMGHMTPITNLGSFIADYFALERKVILSDYNKALAFFAAQYISPLPALMNAWHNQPERQRIIQEARLINPPVVVQIAGLFVDIGMQIALTSGESYTEQLFGEDDQKEYKALMDQQTAIQRNFQSFQATLAQKTNDTVTQQSKAFTQKFEALNKQREFSQQRLIQEINYLSKSVDFSVPKTRYLSAPITYDQYFGASPMNMLPGIAPWYNVFQNSWLFDKTSMKFIQQSIIPFGSVYEAAQNSIFTEYITGKKKYVIEAEISIIDVTYPFFAGIIFNKARWLSGSEERMQQYRLVGLYGSIDKTIVLTFAQTNIQPATDGSPTITTPLAQISNAQTRPLLYKLSQEDIGELSKNPLTLILQIETSLLRVGIILFKKEGDQKKQLASTTIENLDPSQSRSLFWYHGIGCMSPGCQALFTILQPIDIMQGSISS